MDGAKNNQDPDTLKVTKRPSASSKKLSEIIQDITNIAIKPIKLFFQDESRFGRISQAIRCWSPIGCRPVVPSQIVREYLYAYGAVCPTDGSFVSLILPDMRTECLSIFLAEMSLRYPDNHLIVVLDGAASHRSSELQVPDNMTLVTLPPYSPELNPQEAVWKEIKPEGFYNRVFNSLDEVEKQLVKVLRQFENQCERLKKLTAWSWILNALN
jgi:transposase